MNAVIWHNPRCGTSRNTLALLRHAGIEPTVVEYLKQVPDKDALVAMISAAGISVREAIRSKEAEYAARGLADPALSDDALLEAMVAAPIASSELQRAKDNVRGSMLLGLESTWQRAAYLASSSRRAGDGASWARWARAAASWAPTSARSRASAWLGRPDQTSPMAASAWGAPR